MKNVKSIQLIERAIKELSFNDQRGVNGKELQSILERMKRESNYKENTASQIDNEGYQNGIPYQRTLTHGEALNALRIIDRETERLNALINKASGKTPENPTIMNLMD